MCKMKLTNPEKKWKLYARVCNYRQCVDVISTTISMHFFHHTCFESNSLCQFIYCFHPRINTIHIDKERSASFFCKHKPSCRLTGDRVTIGGDAFNARTNSARKLPNFNSFCFQHGEEIGWFFGYLYVAIARATWFLAKEWLLGKVNSLNIETNPIKRATRPMCIHLHRKKPPSSEFDHNLVVRSIEIGNTKCRDHFCANDPNPGILEHLKIIGLGSFSHHFIFWSKRKTFQSLCGQQYPCLVELMQSLVFSRWIDIKMTESEENVTSEENIRRFRRQNNRLIVCGFSCKSERFMLISSPIYKVLWCYVSLPLFAYYGIGLSGELDWFNWGELLSLRDTWSLTFGRGPA